MSKPWPSLALQLASLFAASTSAAVDDAPAAGGTEAVDPAPAEAAPLPSFMAAKHKLDDFDLSRKVEGRYATPIPLFDVDPDTGIGFGARGYYYWDGTRADPLYEYTPYRHRLSAQAFVTTRGYQDYAFEYDGPYLADSPYRVRAGLEYEKNISANYFGRGEGTLSALAFPGAPGRSFSTFSAYTAALDAYRGGADYSLYNKYLIEDPSLSGTLERDLFKGLVRVQAGLVGQYVHIGDYTSQTVTVTDPSGKSAAAIEEPTRLHADDRAGAILGYGGGWNNTLKLGVAFDTRDYELDPNSGVFADVTAEIATRALGSAYDYARVTASPRVFWSPIPKITDVVLAGRVVYSVQTSGTPFFSMNDLAFTDGDHQGLGGIWTLRGYNQDRFVGSIVAMTNVELRWTFTNFTVLDQRFSLAVVPFLDMGRVFDRVGEFTFAGWERGQGGGARIAWNKATIIRADVGVSTEGWDYYMDFGQQF